MLIPDQRPGNLLLQVGARCALQNLAATKELQWMAGFGDGASNYYRRCGSAPNPLA